MNEQTEGAMDINEGQNSNLGIMPKSSKALTVMELWTQSQTNREIEPDICWFLYTFSFAMWICV